MFGLGFAEILLILAIIIIFFGRNRLAQIGENLGKGLGGIKKSINKD